MQKAIIKDGTAREVRNKPGANKEWVKLRQTAWVFINDKPFPTEFYIDHWPDRQTGEVPKPLQVGEYEMVTDVSSVGQYGELNYRTEYVPVKK